MRCSWKQASSLYMWECRHHHLHLYHYFSINHFLFWLRNVMGSAWEKEADNTTTMMTTTRGKINLFRFNCEWMRMFIDNYVCMCTHKVFSFIRILSHEQHRERSKPFFNLTFFCCWMWLIFAIYILRTTFSLMNEHETHISCKSHNFFLLFLFTFTK
jgi:hypothetical protein